MLRLVDCDREGHRQQRGPVYDRTFVVFPLDYTSKGVSYVGIASSLHDDVGGRVHNATTFGARSFSPRTIVCAAEASDGGPRALLLQL